MWASQTVTALIDLTMATGNLLFGGLMKSFSNYNQPDHTAIAYIRANVFAFSHAKSLVQMKELSNLVTDRDYIRSFGEFETEAAKISGRYNRTYLRTEYNTVVASGQMGRKYLETQADKDVFPLLRWSSVNDERTRPDHARMDGITLPADHSFWKSHWPPIDHQCRCDVEQRRTGRITPTHHAVTRAKAAVTRSSPFYGNAMATGEVVNRNHSYFPGKRIKYSGLRAVQDYGLRTGAKIYNKGGLPSLKPGFNSRKEWEDHFAKMYRENGGQDGRFSVQDKLGRPVIMDQTTKKHVKRFKYGGSIEDVLKNPDEVFSDHHKAAGRKKTFGFRYVKFYGETPVVVVVEPFKKELRVTTVYDVKVENLPNVRKGVLHHVDRP